MGFLSDLFGGGESKSTTQQVDIYTPEQKALLSQLIGMAGQGWGPSVSYPGQMYSPANAQELAFMNAASQYGSGDAAAGRQAAIDRILGGQYTGPKATQMPAEQAQQYWANQAPTYDVAKDFTDKAAYEITPEASEKYYQQAFYNPMMRDYQQNIAPQVMESASGAGFRSSDTLRQMGNAATDLSTQLGAQKAGLVYSDELARRQALENQAARRAAWEEATAGRQTAANRDTASWTQENQTLAQQLMAQSIENSRNRNFTSRENAQALNMGLSQQAQQLAAQLAMSPENIQTGALGALGSAGAYKRGIDEAQLASEYQRWMSGEAVGGTPGVWGTAATQIPTDAQQGATQAALASQLQGTSAYTPPPGYPSDYTPVLIGGEGGEPGAGGAYGSQPVTTAPTTPAPTTPATTQLPYGRTAGGGVYNPMASPNIQFALSLLGLSPYAIGQNVESSGAGLLNSLLGSAASGLSAGLGGAWGKSLFKS